MMFNITVSDHIHVIKYYICQTYTTRIQPPTIMCQSSDLGSRWNHVIRRGVLLKTPLQRLIPILSQLSFNLPKHSEPYYPCVRIHYLAHTVGQNSLSLAETLNVLHNTQHAGSRAIAVCSIKINVFWDMTICTEVPTFRWSLLLSYRRERCCR